MILTGLCRLGRDAELRYMPDGTAVLGLAIAYNYGKKDEQGKRATQWVDASLFGDRSPARQLLVVPGKPPRGNDDASRAFVRNSASVGTGLGALNRLMKD